MIEYLVRYKFRDDIRHKIIESAEDEMAIYHGMSKHGLDVLAIAKIDDILAKFPAFTA